MPFAVHTMDPGCPVVAIEKTAEAAWQAADMRGIKRENALVLPCARTIDAAVADADGLVDAQRKLEFAEETAEELKRSEAGLTSDLNDAEKRADEAGTIIDKVKTHLRMAIKRVEKPSKRTDDETRLSLASSALHDALTLAKGGDLDAIPGAA